MAVKPILEINVDDSKFKAFKESFEAYTDKLEEMPEAWRKLGEAMGLAGAKFQTSGEASASALERSAKALEEIVASLNDASHAQRNLGRETHVTHSAFKGLVSEAKGLGQFLMGAGRTLLKLSGGIGLLGLGGGLGLFGLAESAYQRQRGALGLGLSPGQVSAFSTHLSPFVNAEGLLSGAANARNDLTKWWAFSAMGIPVNRAINENPENLSFDLINSARRIWSHGPQTLQYAQARGLTQFFSLDELRRLAATSPADLQKAENLARTDAGTLGFSRTAGNEWTNLRVQLKRAGIAIESTLIEGLGGLAPKFAHLSEALAGDLVKILNSKGTQKIIGDLVSGMGKFADFIDSPKFLNDVKTFEDGIADLAKAIGWVSAKADFSPTDWGKAWGDIGWWAKRGWNDISDLWNFKTTPLSGSQKSHLPAPARLFEEGVDAVKKEYHHYFGPRQSRNMGRPSVTVRVENHVGAKIAVSANAAAH